MLSRYALLCYLIVYCLDGPDSRGFFFKIHQEDPGANINLYLPMLRRHRPVSKPNLWWYGSCLLAKALQGLIWSLGWDGTICILILWCILYYLVIFCRLLTLPLNYMSINVLICNLAMKSFTWWFNTWNNIYRDI